MFVNFKTFKQILLSSGWIEYNSGLTATGQVRFFKGGLATNLFDAGGPVVGMAVADRLGQFYRDITFNIPRDRLEKTLVGWLSQVETEYKFFCL